MRSNVKVLTLASYLSMLFLGLASTMIGAAARNINLSPFQIGLFLVVQNIGFMIAVWISGAMADNHEKPKLLLFGSLILAFSLFTFYLTGIFWLNLIIMMIIGLGIGTYEGVTDAMLLDMHSERQSLHININHFFVTFGSILITLYLIYLQMNWRNSLIQSAVIVLILALVYGIFGLPVKQRQEEDYMQRVKILTRERLVVALFVATVLVVGVEIGMAGILTTFLMDNRDFTQITSKVGLVTFLAGIAAGRVLIGLISQKGQIFHYLLSLFGFATITFTFLLFIDLGQWIYLGTFLAGLGLSALLPLMIALAGIAYPQMAGTVIGSIKVAIPVGGILIPLFMSLLASATTFQISLLVFPLALFLAFCVILLEYRRLPAFEREVI